MEIKSNLNPSDFAEAVALAREGSIDSLHRLIESFMFLVAGYAHRYQHYSDNEDIQSSVKLGLVEGIIRGIDGRIPNDDLYSHLGPYATARIKGHIQLHFEQKQFIRIPYSTYKNRGANLVRPIVVSLESLGNKDGSIEELIPAPEPTEIFCSASEILELLCLTAREQEVLAYVMAGMRQTEISAIMKISKSYVSMILKSITTRAIEKGLQHVCRSRRRAVSSAYSGSESFCDHGEVDDRSDPVGTSEPADETGGGMEPDA